MLEILGTINLVKSKFSKWNEKINVFVLWSCQAKMKFKFWSVDDRSQKIGGYG